jgi:hypothetical protein
LYPSLERYYIVVRPIPPAADEITTLIYYLFFLIFVPGLFILKGSIYFLIEKKEVMPIGPYIERYF